MALRGLLQTKTSLLSQWVIVKKNEYPYTLWPQWHPWNFEDKGGYLDNNFILMAGLRA